jgi:hypothetical protein
VSPVHRESPSARLHRRPSWLRHTCQSLSTILQLSALGGSQVGLHHASFSAGTNVNRGKGTGSPSCSRLTCTGYIEQAVKQVPRRGFESVVSAICEEYNPDGANEELALLQAYTEATTYEHVLLTSSAPGPASMHPCTPLSAMKRAASPELPRQWKRTRLPLSGLGQSLPSGSNQSPPSLEQLPPSGSDQSLLSLEQSPPSRSEQLPPSSKQSQATLSKLKQCYMSDTAIVQLTLNQLDTLIEMNSGWKEQRQKLALWLTTSCSAQPPPSTATPSLPSPKLAAHRQFPSDGTIPCTYPDKEVSSLHSSSPSTTSTILSSIVVESPEQAQPDVSSSITEPQVEPAPKLGAVRVDRSGKVAYHVKSKVNPRSTASSSKKNPRSTTSSEPTKKSAADFFNAFQQVKQDYSPAAKAAKAEIRRQARAAGVHAEFQSMLIQPRIPFPRKPNELRCSDQK